MTNISHSKSVLRAIQGQLSSINRGANGAIAGAHVWIIAKCNKGVDIQGSDNDRIRDIPIVTAGKVALMHVITIGRVLNTQRRNWCPFEEKGKAIYPSGQKEAFKLVVHDTSTKLRGRQKSETVNGYFIPNKFQNVLPFFTAHTYKDLEWKTLPYITITPNVDWDPHIPCDKLEYEKEWVNLLKVLPTPVTPLPI